MPIDLCDCLQCRIAEIWATSMTRREKRLAEKALREEYHMRATEDHVGPPDPAAADEERLDLTPEQPEPTFEDAVCFGLHQWVYCASHLNPHLTGWCTVGLEQKVALGIQDTGGLPRDEQRAAALRKCRHLGLKLFADLA